MDNSLCFRRQNADYSTLIVLLTLPLLCWTAEKQGADIRLPRDVIPTHYRLDLIPHLEGKFIFNGRVWIQIQAKDQTDLIVLHSKGLDIEKNSTKILQLYDPGSNSNGARLLEEEEVRVINHEEDPVNEFLILNLEAPLIPGAEYELRIVFSGTLADNLNGFYKISYRAANSTELKYMAATVFEPANARHAFPCFDEPGLKARFQINLAHLDNMTTLSNMPIKSSINMTEQPGWIWDRYEETPPIPTYLAAWVIGDLDYRQIKDVRGRPVRVYGRYELLENSKFALNLTPRIISALENYIGVVDPMPKTDLVGLPKFVTEALENWGVISFRERHLLPSPEESSSTARIFTASIIAHELAHTWFGNLVTIDWWDSIWLNEGLATYFSTIAVQKTQADLEVDQRTAVRAFLEVFAKDGLRSSQALTAVTSKNSDLPRIFNTITYYKGYYLVRMLNHSLGEASFRAGISRYVSRHQFGTVVEDDLWSALMEQAIAHKVPLPPGVSIKDLMGPWCSQPGYPLISVERNYTANTATITQKRFLRYKSDAGSPKVINKTASWWVPLSFASQHESLSKITTRPRLWLNPRLKKVHLTNIPGDDAWILFNLHASGLYRVNYDLHNWQLLADFLDSDKFQKIPVENRALLLDDAMDLARAEMLPYGVAFNMTRYLSRENHFLPWMAAVNNLEYIKRMLRTTDSNAAFQKYLAQTVSPQFEKVGFHSKPGEESTMKLYRRQIVKWACSVDHQGCVDGAIALFRSWQQTNGSTNNIPLDVQSVIYCTAIAHGSKEDWEFLWNAFKQSNRSSERSRMLEGLGCSRDKETLDRFLLWSTKEDSWIKKQYSKAVLEAVAKNPVGCGVATTFLKENRKSIEKFIGNSPLDFSKLLSFLASSMNQQEQLNQLREFKMQTADSLRSAYQLIEETTELVEINISWLRSNYLPIANWLQERSRA